MRDDGFDVFSGCVRIDVERAETVDLIVALNVTDKACTHAWHLRRGVVEVVEDIKQCRRKPDVEIATEFDNWLRFFTCRKTLAHFLNDTKITTGALRHAEQFFNLFDFVLQIIPIGC